MYSFIHSFNLVGNNKVKKDRQLSRWQKKRIHAAYCVKKGDNGMVTWFKLL